MEAPVYWKSRMSDIEEIMQTVKKGKARTVAKTPGGRDVWLAEYGEKQDFNRTATYSSACGAKDVNAYADKRDKKPVVFIIGAEHGSEIEGTVACVNLIKMIETGTDFAGNSIPFLRDCIDKIRLLVIPIANPDGRARFPVITAHGLKRETFRGYGQGFWNDGSRCVYPKAKAFQPIKKYSSKIGAYYNDDGVNLVHDNFFGKK